MAPVEQMCLEKLKKKASPETRVFQGRKWVLKYSRTVMHAHKLSHAHSQEIWIINASLSVTAPFSFFRHSSCSAIFSGCWQLWGINVLNIVFVLALLSLKVTQFFFFWSTKHDSFSPKWEWNSGKSSVRFFSFFLPPPHLWITSSGGFLVGLEPWQNMNHSCNNSCALVCRQPCRGMLQPLTQAEPFVLTAVTMKQRWWLIFHSCLMACAILTYAYLVLVKGVVFVFFVKYSLVASLLVVTKCTWWLMESLVLWCSRNHLRPIMNTIKELVEDSELQI